MLSRAGVIDLSIGHIATGWDFRAMLEFRDRRVKELHLTPKGARLVEALARVAS